MDDFAILNLMIKEKAKVKLDESSSSGAKVILKEIDLNQVELYTLSLLGMPDEDNAIVIKADIFDVFDRVFKGKNGECKRSDFIIIARLDDRRKYVVYIELKARPTTSKENEIIQQLQGTQCFFTYCQELGKVFWQEKNFLNGYKPRFVSIRNIGLNKRPTREKARTLHDCPDRMLKLNSAKFIQFNQLIGK
jgi:hypothetical protein